MVKQPLTWPSLDNEWEKRVSFVGIDYKYFLENKYFNKRYEFSLKDPVSHSLKETLCTFTLWPGRVTSLYRSWNVSCRSWNGTTSMHPIKLISNGPSAALTLMTSSPHPNDQGKECNQHRNPSSFPRKPKHCSRTFLSSPHPPTYTHPGPTIHMPQWGTASGGVLCLWFCETELSRCSSEKSQDLGGTLRFTLSDPCGTRINYTPESNRGGYISTTVLVSSKDPGLLEGGSYLVGGECENSIQVFYQLLEGGSLWGHRMPTVSHHHIPGRDGFPRWIKSLSTRGHGYKPVLIVNMERCPQLRKCIRTSLAAKLGGGIHFAKRGTAWFLWKALGFTKTSR